MREIRVVYGEPYGVGQCCGGTTQIILTPRTEFDYPASVRTSAAMAVESEMPLAVVD